MKRMIRASQSSGTELENNALFCKEGDRVYDKVKDQIGKVIKTGQSGNYDLIYVDFNDGSKPLRINPMDDAQTTGRFYKVAD